MSVLDVLKKKDEGKKAAPAAKEAAATPAPVHASVVRNVIKTPHASEKAYGLHAQNQYVFIVDPSANKTLVKEEVQRHYHVKVTDVNIVVHKGKVKNFRGRPTKASISKKAIVTLKEGDKIEIV